MIYLHSKSEKQTKYVCWLICLSAVVHLQKAPITAGFENMHDSQSSAKMAKMLTSIQTKRSICSYSKKIQIT